MRLISWNLLHGQRLLAGTPGNSNASINPESGVGATESPVENLQEIAKILADLRVDLIALQEIDENQARSGELAQIKTIAENLGAKDWGYARSVIGTPGVRWRKLELTEDKLITNRSTIQENFQASYGIGLISKVPVKEWHLIQLGRSRIGLPLAVGSEKGIRLMYVKDEPRIAIAAELENGYTVALTHLSFVPLVNLYQLWRIKRWISKLPGKPIILGDLNLPFNLPIKFQKKWVSLSDFKTYPSWGAKIQFDYALTTVEVKKESHYLIAEEPSRSSFSDHLPVIIEIN